jgi:hypothetical protein
VLQHWADDSGGGEEAGEETDADTDWVPFPASALRGAGIRGDEYKGRTGSVEVNVAERLRLDYYCDETLVQEIVKWVSVMSDREKEIFEKRLEGKSMRKIGREMGITHFTVSGIINSWDKLQENLESSLIATTAGIKTWKQ